MTKLAYAVITPVRDEREHLRRLYQSLEAQSIQPLRWLIVDNGSTDGTTEIAKDIATYRRWIRVVDSTSWTAKPEPGKPIVRAFHAGLDELDLVPDIVVKLDADVSFEPDYFERQLDEFASDQQLGIASGTCMEFHGGKWVPMTDATDGHVRGAARAYRWSCLQDVLPLADSVGWDGIDGFKANLRGWRTHMFAEFQFRHHRPVGRRDGGRTARWRRQGRGAWYMGYRPAYLVTRSLYCARRDPAAITMATTYAWEAIRRRPRHDDQDVRAYIRRTQNLAHILERARSSRLQP